MEDPNRPGGSGLGQGQPSGKAAAASGAQQQAHEIFSWSGNEGLIAFMLVLLVLGLAKEWLSPTCTC